MAAYHLAAVPVVLLVVLLGRALANTQRLQRDVSGLKSRMKLQSVVHKIMVRVGASEQERERGRERGGWGKRR